MVYQKINPEQKNMRSNKRQTHNDKGLQNNQKHYRERKGEGEE